MMSVFISVVNPTERLRELERACVPPRQQAGTRHHGRYGKAGTGTPDVRVP